MSQRFWLSCAATALVAALAVVAVSASEHGRAAEQAGNAVHVGEPFGASEMVEIAALLADPDRYEGRAVRLQGSVASYCLHQRGWFALADTEGSVVRLVTAPAFRVPGSIEKVPGVGEGVVEIVEVPEAQAKHYAGDHGLGSQRPEEISGPQRQVIVRASGAEFVLPPGAEIGDATEEVKPCEEHGDEEGSHPEQHDHHD